MYIFKHRARVVGLAVVLGLLLSVMVAPTALASDEEEFDMNDRFAAGTPTGASGSGEVEVDDGSVEIEVGAEGLLPNHAYELKVTIGPAGGFAPTSVVTFGPVTSDDDGEIEFEEDLGLAPGTYRVDLFVTHIHPTVAGSGPTGAALTALFNRDPLLSCQPAPTVTVAGDDDD